MTTEHFLFFCTQCLISQEPKAAVNLTMSKGVRLSPLLPPIVPLIPEMDFMSANVFLNLILRMQRYNFRWNVYMVQFTTGLSDAESFIILISRRLKRYICPLKFLIV